MNPKDMTLEQIRAELKAIREGRSVFGDGGDGRECNLEVHAWLRARQYGRRHYDTRK